MERKENMDKDKREQLRSMQKANSLVPGGNVASYA